MTARQARDRGIAVDTLAGWPGANTFRSVRRNTILGRPAERLNLGERYDREPRFSKRRQSPARRSLKSAWINSLFFPELSVLNVRGFQLRAEPPS